MPFTPLRLTLALSAALFTSAHCAAFQNEPEGFRGLAWGASVASSADLVVARTQAPGELHVERGERQLRLPESAGYYVRNGDKLGVGPVAIDTIHYLFHEDRLVSVTLTYRDSTHSIAGERYSYQYKLGDKKPRNYEAKDAVDALLREKFGEPTSAPNLIAKLTMRLSKVEYLGETTTILSECDAAGFACLLEFRATAANQAYLRAAQDEVSAARAKAAANAARPDF